MAKASPKSSVSSSKKDSQKVPVYNHKTIEKKWQKVWERTRAFRAKDAGKKKFYALIEFPYPSGEGLHVGHIRSNTAMDIISRKRRREGYNVLYPIGWDAFGLPTENYAIKTGIQPAIVTKRNTDTFRKQLKALGFSFDWDREVDTTDPKYYRWTQWIFLQFLKEGLAYKKKMYINWCPKDLIGLANEEVVNGCCERCGTPVEKREKEQWMLAITRYAERLLRDLDASDYVAPKVIDKINPHQPGKPLVERQVAHAIVYDPAKNKYLIIRNKKHGWDTIIIGGIEGSETPEETARREIREETGYTDVEFKRILGGPTEAHYYTKHKGENRIAYARAAYFELRSDKRVPIADGEDKDNEILWIDPADFVPGKMVNSELPIWLERLKDPSKGIVKPLLTWKEHIKESQRNWIGRSEGALVRFKLADQPSESIDIFTTRIDTIFSGTFIILSPEHPFIDSHRKEIQNWDAVSAYISKAVAKGDIDRESSNQVDWTGVELTGIQVLNPATNEKIPVWVADFVLSGYGTGAVFADAHDSRDFFLAKKYSIPLKVSIAPSADKIEAVKKLDTCYEGEGILFNSQQFDGLTSAEARPKITTWLKEKGTAEFQTTYKLRDWVFSRQRYWGEPIPVVLCARCGVVPVPEKDLPVKLPKVQNYAPTKTGESPLAAIADWVNVKCPMCKDPAKRETDTMPNWAGSSWYYLRYTDAHNTRKFADYKKLKYWTPVDWYNGGMEHTTLHLLYSRFWHKFLFDQGLVPTSEPYTKRTSHGLILAEGGEKMSKSKGNVINPDTLVEQVGADTLRIYEMFMGPFDQAIAWDTKNIAGSRRFVERIWRLQEKLDKKAPADARIDKLIHRTIKKVSEDIESMQFNTAISALMIAVNELEKETRLNAKQYSMLVQLVAPFAPHIAEEIWQNMAGKGSIHAQKWPVYDESKLVDDEVSIVVQINGKVRGSFRADKGVGQEQAQKMAQQKPEIAKWLENSEIKKVIFVPDKLINIVAVPHNVDYNTRK